MNTDKPANIKHGWLTAGAVAVLLAAQASVAQQQQQQPQPQQAQPQQQQQMQQQPMQMAPFEQLDQDNDGSLQWQDLESEYNQELQQAQWDQQQVMQLFDADQDQQISEQEYDSFQTALRAQLTTGPMAQQPQQQQPEQQQPMQQQQQQAQEDTTLLSMPVEQVMQAEIVNSRGEQIGQVARVVRNNATGDLALVVRSGGIFGLGGSRVVVDLKEVSQMGENQLLWDTMLSKDEIAQMPEFDETQYTEISAEEYPTLGEAQQRG